MNRLKALSIAVVTTMTLSACHPVFASDKFLDLDRSKYLPETQATFASIEKSAREICSSFEKSKKSKQFEDCVNIIAEDYVDSLILGMEYQERFGVKPKVKKAYDFFFNENKCGTNKTCADHSLNQAVFFNIGYSVSELSNL